MSQVTITINSREYAVACEDGQEVSIIKLSRMLDERARMLTNGNAQVNENMLLAMVGLLLADELTELKKGTPAPEQAAPQITAELDNVLATQIQELTQQINSLANQINSL